MTVYLVPVGRGRYQLYCEVRESASDAEDAAPPHDPRESWWRRQRRRFRRTLADAEAERVRRERGQPPSRHGLKGWILGRLAEAVAEQRLLWHLRGQTAGLLVHPDLMTGAEALALARTEFASDARRRLWWCLVDAAIASVLGVVFFFVPGPNLIAYYFTFRAVGHFFALRGARQGLLCVSWQTEASRELMALSAALDLDAPERRRRLDEIAHALGLQALTGFVERVARRAS